MKSELLAKITKVALDSRDASPGAVFVALVGKRTDGHRYIGEAYARGARVFIVNADRLEQAKKQAEGALFIYEEGKSAEEVLIELAAQKAAAYQGKIIGITGSTGKTTTKEFIGQALAKKKKAYRARRSYNTPIGLAAAVLEAPEDADYWVLEYGAGKPGDIAELLRIAAPHWAVLTNIGVAHLAYFGSREAIYSEKSRLLERAEAAVLNLDCPFCQRAAEQAEKAGVRVVTVSRHQRAHLQAEISGVDEQARPEFFLRMGKEQIRLKASFCGLHHVDNALLAGGVLLLAGFSLPEIGKTLAELTLPKMRLQVIEREGVVYLNDAYNSNPVSLQAALETAALMKHSRLVGVIGDMLELGDRAAFFHRAAGEQARKNGFSLVIYVGDHADDFAAGFQGKLLAVRDAAEAATLLKEHVRPGDVVLIKASRRLGLERVLADG